MKTITTLFASIAIAATGYAQNTFPSSGNVGIGTTSPNANLEVAGTVKIQGVPVDPSLPPDNAIYFAPQAYFEAGAFPFPLLAGTAPVFALTSDPAVPFGKVALSNGLTEFASDFIPVQPGETLYGEIWAMRPSGSAGTPGLLYYGVARYDKAKRPIAGNSALDYFSANAVTVAQNDIWTKYSGTTTLPLSHTPYNDSDGGPVRYVRAYIIVNYNAGTIPTYWGGVVLRRAAPFRDAAPVVFNGNVGIGTTTPVYRLEVVNNTGSGFVGATSFGLNSAFIGTRFNGTVSSPTQVLANQVIGGLYSSAYGTGDTSRTYNSLVGQYAAENQTSTAKGSYITIETTNLGALSRTEKVRIDPAGNIGIGTTNPRYKVEVSAGDTRNVYLDTSDYPKIGTTYGSGSSIELYNGSTGAMTFTTGAPSYPFVFASGNVGIGTCAPTHKLAVNGTIRAKEVIVDTGWADYVFAKGYRLAPLAEVEQHIEREGHLPGIPSSAEVAERGVSMGEMQAKLLAKVEELTLHQIAQEKELRALKAQNTGQQTEIASLRAEVTRLSTAK